MFHENMKVYHTKEYLKDREGSTFLEANDFGTPSENISASTSIHMTQISANNPRVPLMQNLQLQNTSFSTHQDATSLPLQNSSLVNSSSSHVLGDTQNEFNSNMLLQDSLHYIPSAHQKICKMKSPKR